MSKKRKKGGGDEGKGTNKKVFLHGLFLKVDTLTDL